MRNCILRFFQTLTSGVIVLGLFAGGNLQAESPKVASQSTPQFIPRPILDSIKSEISENLRESEKKGPVVWVKKLESMKAISVGDVDSRDLLLRAFSKIPRVNMTLSLIHI